MEITIPSVENSTPALVPEGPRQMCLYGITVKKGPNGTYFEVMAAPVDDEYCTSIMYTNLSTAPTARQYLVEGLIGLGIIDSEDDLTADFTFRSEDVEGTLFWTEVYHETYNGRTYARFRKTSQTPIESTSAGLVQNMNRILRAREKAGLSTKAREDAAGNVVHEPQQEQRVEEPADEEMLEALAQVKAPRASK